MQKAQRELGKDSVLYSYHVSLGLILSDSGTTISAHLFE